MLVAQVPQTARVNKKELKAPDVAFTGDPQFTPIEQTTVQRAENTDKDIFKVGEAFYSAIRGCRSPARAPRVHGRSQTPSPRRCSKIPVSSPAHYVTYVTVEDDDANDDWVVYAAATAIPA